MAPSGNSLGESLSEKLTGEKFMIWKTQAMPAIRGAQLAGYLDGSIKAPEVELITKDDTGKELNIPNPAYARWIAEDQTVLGYLLRNMTREVLVQVAGLESAEEVWVSVTEMFSAVSQSRIVHLHTALAKTQKENMSAKAYFGRIKSLADEMANAGERLDDTQVISYILAGLDDQYDGFVASITTLLKTATKVTVSNLFSMFLPYEARLEGRTPGNGSFGGGSDISANAASRGGYGNRGGGGGYGQRGGRNNGGRGNYGGGRGGGQQNYNGGGGFYPQNNNGGGGGFHPQGGQYQQRQGGGERGQGGGASDVTCQICGKVGHPAFRCWKRFNKNYQSQADRSVGAATSSYGIDTNWYSIHGRQVTLQENLTS
jgi:hypothetical protein